MRQIKLFRMVFDAPLHLGNVRDDFAESTRRLHSDTLYAAIINAWAVLGMEDILQDLSIPVGPNFKISSAFPFTVTETGIVYFLPRPFKQFHISLDRRSQIPNIDKVLKEIEWLDLDYFPSHVSTSQGIEPIMEDIQEIYLSTSKIDVSFIQGQVEPKVSVPRIDGEDPDIHYMERLNFKKGSGLYFLFEGENYEAVRTALDFLSEEGIGSDRTYGNGTFELIEENDTETLNKFDMLFENSSDYHLNLSLFIPQSQSQLKEILKGENVGYYLLRRGGWITTEPYLTLKKNSVFMFREGSVFAGNSFHENPGATVDLMPKIFKGYKNYHPIFRTGKSFFVPISF